MDRLKGICIVHINTSTSWRGGEQQTYFLTSRLHGRGYKSYCICQKDSPLHEKLSKDELPHFPLKMRSEFDLFAAKNISIITKRLKTRILHMHTAHAHSLGFFSNLFFKIPVNIVSRRVDFRVRKNIFSRLKYKYPQKYISVSNAIRDILIEDGISFEKVIAVHSGIDISSYDNLAFDHIGDEYSYVENIENKVKLVNVAALTDQKDHETLIKSMKVIARQYNDCVLFIVGDGKLRHNLIKLRDDSGLKDKIIFTGFRSDAFNFIKFADIFVMSSRWEGLGTSIIDAMVLQKPIIATQTGGIPELIKNGENGLLVEKENPEALANAILKLCRDKNLRERLSLLANKDSNNFLIQNTVDKTIEVYESFAETFF